MEALGELSSTPMFGLVSNDVKLLPIAPTPVTVLLTLALERAPDGLAMTERGEILPTADESIELIGEMRATDVVGLTASFGVSDCG